MSTIFRLGDHLQQQNPYPALSILESAVVCCRRRAGPDIPRTLLEDIAAMFGKETVELQLQHFLQNHILDATKRGIELNRELLPALSSQLNRLKKSMRLKTANQDETAGQFIQNMAAYLRREVPGLVINEENDETEYDLLWNDEKYRLQLAVSPVWMPAVAEEAAVHHTFHAAIGPFAAQNWLNMMTYYKYPEFRNYTAYFDPWHQQKMNISRGGLLTYLDWFFRDCYGLKFFIPEAFGAELHNLGLLRYNDEK